MKNKITANVALTCAIMILAGNIIGCAAQNNSGGAQPGAGGPAETNTAGETADTQTAEGTAADAQASGDPAADTQAAGEAAENTEAADGTQGAASGISGSLSMAGSTSMEKIANALAESFMAKYPEVTVTAEFTGSSAGVEAVTAGSVDIGNSSRNLTEEETAAGAVENIVAIDGIAVVTDPANPVSGLTKQQLSDVYTGKLTNWKELGGEDLPVVVVGREAGSGTRSAFEEILEVEDACAYANELDSTGAVMAKVGATPGAIGYVSLDVMNDTVKALMLDNVEPTVENIKAGSYFLSRPFVMATKGETAEQSELVKAFFAYLASDEGKKVIADTGLITVD